MGKKNFLFLMSGIFQQIIKRFCQPNYKITLAFIRSSFFIILIFILNLLDAKNAHNYYFNSKELILMIFNRELSRPSLTKYFIRARDK